LLATVYKIKLINKIQLHEITLCWDIYLVTDRYHFLKPIFSKDFHPYLASCRYFIDHRYSKILLTEIFAEIVTKNFG